MTDRRFWWGYLLRPIKNFREWKAGVYRRSGLVADYRFLKLSRQYTQRAERLKEKK